MSSYNFKSAFCFAEKYESGSLLLTVTYILCMDMLLYPFPC